MKSVILLSGGLDSCVAAAKILSEGNDLIALSVDYGQKHRKELDHAGKIAERLQNDYPHLSINHWQLPINNIMGHNPFIGSSALTGSGDIPEGHYAEESMKSTVVPNRNMILLSFAVAVAISNDSDSVYYAAHAGDHAIYPDCRPDFVNHLAKAAFIASDQTVKIIAPFIDITKSDIVQIGYELGAPMELTWSCYKGTKLPCGVCSTDRERRWAFQNAGIPDPTEYDPAGLLKAPDSVILEMQG